MALISGHIIAQNIVRQMSRPTAAAKTNLVSHFVLFNLRRYGQNKAGFLPCHTKFWYWGVMTVQIFFVDIEIYVLANY